MSELVSANTILKSLTKKLDELDDKGMMSEVNKILSNLKTTKDVDFEKKASSSCQPDWVELFINTIYDLLESDNKCGRIAACHIFRKLCPVLSPELIINLLSFVIEFNDDTDESDSEDEVSHNDEDDDMPTEDEHSILADDESGSEEETSEDDEKLDIKSLESLKDNMMTSFEASDINLDDVPADELQKFDERMENLMRAYHGKLPAKEDKNIKCRALAEKNIRFRGCDLMKILVKEAVSANHLIIILVPLLKTIQSEQDADFKLIFRKICNDLVSVTAFKKTDLSVDVLAAKELKKLFCMSNKDIGPLLKNGVKFLIKIGEQTHKMNADKSNSRPIFNVISDIIEELFTVKICNINQNLLEIPLSLMKNDFIPISDLIRKHALSKSKKSIKKNVALRLLIKSYQQRPLIVAAPREGLRDFQVSVSTNIIKILNSLIRQNQIQANYMLDFFNLMKFIYILHLKENDCKIGFDWNAVKSAMEGFAARFPKKKMSATIAKSYLGAASTIQMKQPHIAKQKNEIKKKKLIFKDKTSDFNNESKKTMNKSALNKNSESSVIKNKKLYKAIKLKKKSEGRRKKN